MRVDKVMELPDKFELRFGRVSRNCSLIWQEDVNAGVLFEADLKLNCAVGVSRLNDLK